MSTSVLALPRAAARTGKATRRLASAAKTAGGILSFGALALGSAQFYRVSAAAIGPGSFLFTIPKNLGGALAPALAAAGAAGAALGLSALWIERGRASKAAAQPNPQRGSSSPGLGASVIVLAGLAAAAINVAYTEQVVAARADFAAAFGADWQDHIPAGLRGGLLSQRWTWRLAPAQGVRVERDIAFAAISKAGPDTDRKLLADVYSPPAGVPPSGLGFIYLHGGGYSAFDKGGPTEFWFRHLAGQGHVVMDVAYRLIPEATVPEMQGDVKRAVLWLKRNAERYGVNPANIVLSGGSGGAHLALLAAYAPDHPFFTPADLRGVDLSVRGVVAYYLAGDYRPEVRTAPERSVFDKALEERLTPLFERIIGYKLAVDEAGDWDAKLFFGGPAAAWPELYRQVSPITHVGPHTPPTLLIVGEHDVYGQSHPVAVLHAALQAAGAPTVELRLPRTDHAFDLFLPEVSPAAQTAMYDVDRFLALLAAPTHELSWPMGRKGR